MGTKAPAPLQDIDSALLVALVERYGPEAIIGHVSDIKAPRAAREFEKLKIKVDYLLPSLLRPDELLDAPRFTTILAAVAQLRPDLGAESHRLFAKKYQRYRRQAGAKRGICAGSAASLG